jgi:hypothetical protein
VKELIEKERRLLESVDKVEEVKVRMVSELKE